MLFGKQCAVEAHRYCERAVDLVRDLVREHDMQSDFEYTGFLRLATRPGYVKRIQHDLELLTKMGITGIEWIDADKARAEVNSPLVMGAWWEPRCGLLNPAKHVREMKRVAQSAGAVIYEQTPVTEIRRYRKFKLQTPGGTLTADHAQDMEARGLAARARILGEATEAELRGAYRVADVLLFPSHYEGFGFPVLEAMASGLPVVTSGAGTVHAPRREIRSSPHSSSDHTQRRGLKENRTGSAWPTNGGGPVVANAWSALPATTAAKSPMATRPVRARSRPQLRAASSRSRNISAPMATRIAR